MPDIVVMRYRAQPSGTVGGGDGGGDGSGGGGMVIIGGNRSTVDNSPLKNPDGTPRLHCSPLANVTVFFLAKTLPNGNGIVCQAPYR